MFENDLSGYEAQKAKSMKLIKILVVVLIILLLLFIAIIGLIYYAKSTQRKINIDGKEITTLSEDAFITENDELYISIKDLAKLCGGYSYNNGEYAKYSEDLDSCYVQNNYEEATFINESNKISKALLDLKESNGFEYYTIDKPVIKRNDKLYTTSEGLSIGCNVYFYYEKSSNTISIYTLDYLISSYSSSSKLKDSIFNSKEEEIYYSNKKAILYDLVVVKNDKGMYGVVNTEGVEIIGKKYQSIKFIEPSKEFLVTTAENKYGILAADGTTKINPSYDSILKIDEKDGLYLVSKNDKYGVINSKEESIIYIEYDEIGVDRTAFKNDKFDNRFILYDKVIPAKRADSWSLIAKDGTILIDGKYKDLGCKIAESNNKLASSMLLLPDFEGIVVVTQQQGEKYTFGLVNADGEELIPCATDNFYIVTNAGNNTYYLTYQGQTLNVIEYLERMGFKTVTDKSKIKVSDENNVQTEQQTNTKTATNTTTNTVENTVENKVNNTSVTTNKQQEVVNR